MKKNYALNTFVLILLLFTFCKGSAQSFDPTHIYKIVNKSTGKALEVTGDHKFEPNSLIGQGDYSGGAHQQWIIKSVTRTRFYIINRNSRKVMATRDHDKYSGAPYVLRELYDVEQQNQDNFSTWQIWSIEFNTNNNNNYISNVYSNTKLLVLPNSNAISGTTIGFYATSEQQQWEIIDVSTNIWTTTMYNVNSNWVLSATDSRRVTQDKSYSIANQEWTFESIGNNIWAIYSRSNHLALEIGGDDPTTYKAGTPANVWEYTGKTNQQWRIIDDYGNNLTLTDGSPTPVPIPRAIPFYHIINVRTGYALEIGGSTTERLQTNRPANQWPYSGGNHQKWRFGSGDLNRNAPTNPDITPTITFTPAIATITTATDNYDENTNFSVYPNPVQNYLFISSTGMKKVATAQLIDNHGATHTVEVGPDGKINVQYLAAGIYILIVSDGDNTKRQKFVKQ